MNLKALIRTYRAATQAIEFMAGAIFNGNVSTTGTLSATGATTLTGAVTRGARQIEPLITVTYSATPTIDASLGNLFVMTITDGVAFVFAAPTNPPGATDAQEITLTARNTSGGAHGAGTWNAVFKTQATVFPAIANGQSRSIRFRWNGTNWVELWRSAADIAN